MADHLLASIASSLQVVTWQWGGKGPAPKPIVLPGTEKPSAETAWTGKPVTVEEMNALLGWE